MPRPPSSSSSRGRSTGSPSSRASNSRSSSSGEGRRSGDSPRAGDGRPGKSSGNYGRDRSGGPRRDSDDRRPRRDADDRGPRRDSDDRRPRRSADDRRPRRDSDDRGPRRDFDDRRPRRDADDRGPRRDSDDRRPRRDADDRGPRRSADDRGPRRDSDDRRPRWDADDRGPRRDADDRRSRQGERRGPRPEPRTEAERRRAAVRARGGGNARQEDGRIREAAPPERTPEQWIDEGPIKRPASNHDVRRAAQKAVKRASHSQNVSLDPATRLDVEKSVPARRQTVLSDRLQSAQNSLERERFSEAKRVARSLVKEMGGVAAVHEVIGLASYRLGQWRDATAALELARSIRPRVEDLPVLADCYRAQRRWQEVDEIWTELKQFSPSQEILSEGRIIYAGSLADRGDLYGAIAVMMRSTSTPRRVRDHHLRQWYVLADLYDRAGNVQKAREFFKRVAAVDSDFSDVKSRLAQL